MVPEGTAWDRPCTNGAGFLCPTSFPSHFQQRHDPNDQAANHPLSLPTLLIAAWHHTAGKPPLAAPASAAVPGCPPSGESGQGPAAGAGLGATHAGSLPGSRDLSLTSLRIGPFANAQLVFIAFQQNMHRNISLPFRFYKRLFW